MDNEDLVRRVLLEVQELSVHEAAAVLDVSHETVSRWRRGEWKRLRALTGRKLRQFLEERRRAEGSSWEAHVGPSSPFDQLVRPALLTALIRELGPPGTRTGGKRQVLNGFREIITAHHRLPEWWHALNKSVEHAEL